MTSIWDDQLGGLTSSDQIVPYNDPFIITVSAYIEESVTNIATANFLYFVPDLGNSIFTGVDSNSVSVVVQNPIPEPATMLLFGLGLLGLAGVSRKKQ